MLSETKVQVVENAPQIQSALGGKHRVRRGLLAAVIVFLAVVGIVAFGILRRVRARNTVSIETAAMAVPLVNVVSPQSTAPSRELVLPGNVEPYLTAPIYSPTHGFVKNGYFHI